MPSVSGDTRSNWWEEYNQKDRGACLWTMFFADGRLRAACEGACLVTQGKIPSYAQTELQKRILQITAQQY